MSDAVTTIDAPGTDIAAEPPADVRAPARSNPVGLVRRLLSDADLRRSALSVVDQGIVSATNFATSVLIGRLCTQSDLGLYYLALSIWVFVRGVQDQIVLAPYMIYCTRREREGALPSYFGSSLAHEAGLTLLVLGGVIGLAVGLEAGFGPSELRTTAWVLLGTLPFLMLREFVRSYAFSHLKMEMAIAIDVAVSVCQLGGLALLAWTGTLTVARAYMVIGGACAVASFGWLAARTQPIEIGWRATVADWWHNWGFARWALACHLFTSATPFVMPWVVAGVSGSAATGVLAACATIIGLANVFVMGLANYLSPKAAHAWSEGGVDELDRVMRKSLLLFVSTLGAFAVVTLFAGGWLVTLVYGDQYAGAGTIVAVLAFGMLASSVGITAGNGLWAMERPAANFRADLASFVASVVATILLVPTLGVLGAALVTLVANTVDAVVRYATLSKLMSEHRAEAVS